MSEKEQEAQMNTNDTQTSQEESTETLNQEEATVEPQTEEISEVDALKQEVSALKDQHLRLYAEFENHRKRTAKERLELFGTANQELMGAMLPIMDDFERALKNLKSEAAEGVQLIYSKFESTLKNKGLKPMDDTTGESFDVETMEAITRIPAPSKKLKGKVVDQLEKGYRLGNKIIRYAKVVVGE